MEDLIAAEDRLDAGNVAALSQAERDAANRASLERGPAYTLRYRGTVIACGGIRYEPGKDVWFLWINPTRLVAQHKTAFHRTCMLLWAAFTRAIGKRIVVAAVHQQPEYYGKWARHFGFKRIGEAQFDVKVADGSKYDLYVYGGENG